MSCRKLQLFWKSPSCSYQFMCMYLVHYPISYIMRIKMEITYEQWRFARKDFMNIKSSTRNKGNFSPLEMSIKRSARKKSSVSSCTKLVRCVCNFLGNSSLFIVKLPPSYLYVILIFMVYILRYFTFPRGMLESCATLTLHSWK